MTATAISFRAPVLPWAVAAADEARFRRILRVVLAVCVLVGVVFPWLHVAEPERDTVQDLPPRLARIMLERPLVPPAPPARPAPTASDVAKQETTRPEPPKPAPAKEAAVPEARRPVPGRAPGEVEGARRRAAGVGLLAMKEQLAELRGAPVAVQLKQDIAPGRGVGTGSGPGVGAGTDPGIPARALITSNATGGSGGINTAGYSRDTGGGGLAGRATTLVEGVAGGGGGGGPGGGGGGGKGDGVGTGGGAAGGSVQRGASAKAARSIEDIRLVFERNKGAIYAIYNRALREDPGLQGKVVLQLKIAPSGEVIDCRLVSSELKAPELERKLLARIRQFDFGAKDVDTMTVTWPVDFLPS